MVGFTVKDQGESAGVSEVQVLDAAQCSGGWPVLCVYKHSYQLSRKAVLRAEYTSEAEKCLWWGEKKVSVLEGHRGTEFRPH